MTRNEFLITFKKHLLVGEPKRSEIVAELKTHLDELNQTADIEHSFGAPAQLAKRYNRTHIGCLSIPTLIYSVPILTVGLITILKIYIKPGPTTSFSEHILYGDVLSQASTIIIWLAPYLAALGLGFTVARLHRPARWALGLLGLSLISGTAFGILYNLASQIYWETPQLFVAMIWQSIVTAAFQLLSLGALGCGMIIFTAPLRTDTLGLKKTQLELQIITGFLGIFYLLFTFFWYISNDITILNRLYLFIPSAIGLSILVRAMARRLRLWWPLRHSRFTSRNTGKNRVE